MLDSLMAPYTALMNLIDGGGPFVVFIFLSGVLMWTLVMERAWFFWKVLPLETQQYIDQWNARSDHVSWCARQIRDMMISRLNVQMNANLLVMRDAGADGAAARTDRHRQRDARGVRFDGAARLGRRTHHGDRRVARDDLHDDRPRGEHHRVVAGVLLHESGEDRTELFADHLRF